MAGYFDQCACGEYTCVGDTPCRRCLEAEINRLREALEKETNIRIKYQGIVYGVLELLDPGGYKVVVEDTIDVLRSRLEGGGSDERHCSQKPKGNLLP